MSLSNLEAEILELYVARHESYERREVGNANLSIQDVVDATRRRRREVEPVIRNLASDYLQADTIPSYGDPTVFHITEGGFGALRGYREAQLQSPGQEPPPLPAVRVQHTGLQSATTTQQQRTTTQGHTLCRLRRALKWLGGVVLIAVIGAFVAWLFSPTFFDRNLGDPIKT